MKCLPRFKKEKKGNVYYCLNVPLYNNYTLQTISIFILKEKEKSSVTGEDLANARIERKKELYKTLWEKEYEYSDVLVRMLQSFRKPLIDDANSENPSITLDQINTLFDGFDSILNLSWSLCGELKYISNMYKQLKPVNIGDVFLKHAKEFETYFKYSSRFSTANELLRELNDNTKFRRYQYALLESTTLLKDDDYREVLRLPIYHISQYNTILKELLDNTAKYDPSYEMLEDSYEYINELFLVLKEALKKESKIDEILEIRKNIVDCPRSIVKPERYLYRDFNDLLELPTHKPIRIIVFSDVLLIAKWDRKIKKYVFNRVVNYKALKVIDNVSKADTSIFSLLLLNPFSKKNFDIPAPPNNRRFRSVDKPVPYRGLQNDHNDGVGVSRVFSRLFSWSFNQNITRIDIKAPDNETQEQVVNLINKRISELHPPPFELLWPDPKDIFDTDIVKGIRNPVPADPKEILLNSYICNGIYHSFPKRLRIKRSLTLLYSLQNHGSSLSTFYERSNAGYGTAQLLVIKDDNDTIFGCFTAEPFKINNGFYGTGESFLFKYQQPKQVLGHHKSFGINVRSSLRNNLRHKESTAGTATEAPHGTLKIYPWAKTNYLFINSTHEYVAVGSGKGKYGIWCDNNFQRGSSFPTETYHNETLSGAEHFNIVNVELWAFTSQIEREFRRKRQTRFPTKFQKL
ncbi:TLD-domain-containing protein [Piromyces finnis]|uniref:Oxidation resistance protein 1 n=1 Tax=Piromyces finnis TaxID=1754191 RepID=A0A1Y1VB70_9FUNG|nr:TLD-domain-containing protein [Piromyces finnis]|eukprot:ORX51004.1 TLD-domain-containing protein [Piromyces finnis]